MRGRSIQKEHLSHTVLGAGTSRDDEEGQWVLVSRGGDSSQAEEAAWAKARELAKHTCVSSPVSPPDTYLDTPGWTGAVGMPPTP